MKTLHIHIVELKYCPVCGKGWFKKYIKLKKESLQKELNRMYDNNYTFKASCEKCGAKITIEYPKQKYKY